VTKQGVSAIFQTTGNDACHVILRGGSRTGPNYGAEHVAKVCSRLAAKGLPESVMVDCSHGNSLKNHRNQAAVAAAVAEQVAGGSTHILGVMLESHLVEGRQDYVPGEPAVYGQSITDACISLEETEPLLGQLATAQQVRKMSSASV
jgi:3-deoxy-7-phosphoheptulonate synthase